jgi:hypothetical protein
MDITQELTLEYEEKFLAEQVSDSHWPPLFFFLPI